MKKPQTEPLKTFAEEVIELGDVDLIDTSLLKKFGFQSIEDEGLEHPASIATGEELEITFVESMPIIEGLSLEIEADHGV